MQYMPNVPHYIPPPVPDYAPAYMPSPVRPGFEGMPAVPQLGGKLTLRMLSYVDIAPFNLPL